jgi:two-component system sensor histidine kinase YesM
MLCFDEGVPRVFFRNSIFAKLLLSFLLLSTLPLMLASWFTLTSSEQSLNEKLKRETNNILEQKIKTLYFFISDTRRMGDVIAKDPNVLAYLESSDAETKKAYTADMAQLLSGTQSIRPENIGMTLISESGFLYANGYNLRTGITSRSELPWLPIDEIITDNYQISRMHDRSYSVLESDQLVFSFIRFIGDSGFKPRGALVIDFKIDVLRDLLKNIFLLGDIYDDYASGVIVTDKTGEILYPYPAGVFSALDFERLETNYFLIQRYDRMTGWNFTAYFLKSELYKPIYDIRRITLTIMIVSIVVCVFVSLLLSRRISKPILKLRNLIMKVGHGDFNAHYTGIARDEIGALGHGFNLMVRRLQDLVQQVYEEQNQKHRAEITAMQSQINPHFLYNTLESINSLARKTKQKEISHMIIQLGRLLRLSIGTFDDMIPIDKEVTSVRHYLELHKYRMKERFQYDIQLDPQILNLYTIKWILQPIIENTFIHGLDRKQSSGNVELRGWLKDDNVYIRISDNGKGMTVSAVEQLNEDLELRAIQLAKDYGRVGLFNVQSRIRLYFGTNYGIHVESDPGQGVTVTLKLPRKEKP